MQSKSDKLVEFIGKKIVNGEFPERSTLPKMEVIGSDYAVSRTVVREALQVLSRMGMTESVKKTGTIVLPKSNWHWWDQQILQWVIEDINVSGNNHRNFILHLTEMRLALEPMAVYLAAERSTPEDLKEIEKHVLKLKEAVYDAEKWAISDYNFHLSLVKASQNHLMINTLARLNKALILSRKKTYGKLNLNNSSNNLVIDYEGYMAHLELFEAIVDKDADKAKQIIESILLKVYEVMKREIENS